MKLEEFKICESYLESIQKLSHSELLRCAKLFYAFVLVGGLPNDYFNHSEEWHSLWNSLFHQHMRSKKVIEDNTRKTVKDEYQAKLREKEEEIENIKEATQTLNPMQQLEDLFNKHVKLNGNKSERLKMFRISYKEDQGMKSIRSLGFQFSGSDNRAITSKINGKKGGRPRKKPN